MLFMGRICGIRHLAHPKALIHNSTRSQIGLNPFYLVEYVSKELILLGTEMLTWIHLGASLNLCQMPFNTNIGQLIPGIDLSMDRH